MVIMKSKRLWLLVLILLGFGLRLTRLGEQSLWYDEGVTWLLSQMRSLVELVRWTAADIQPPLYYLLIWATDLLFGQSEWALRFPAAIFNTLTIPLIYVLARRLFPAQHGRLPWLAAAIFTLSPLMVYYSQEARMYSLLVFEASLSSYLLLKILAPNQLTNQPTNYSPFAIHNSPFTIRHSLFFPLLYALISTAALYTHYFAAFLLLAHLLYALLILWQRRWPGRLSLQLALTFGLTGLLFLPWLPTLLSRLGDDPSYWPGALKLNEAIRKIFITFTAGETVFEQTGLWLALGYLIILALAGLWIIATRLHTPSTAPSPSNQPTNHPTNHPTNPAPTHHSKFTIHYSPFPIPHSLLFLLLWLLLPPLLILLLSYQSPKFNPRYAILSWPAFALLLAAALDSLLPPAHSSLSAPHSPLHASRFTLYALRFTATLALLFLLASSIFSLFNWFTDPRFSKDDFQALAQFVRERQSGDETVLLSSGHFFPVWAYYYGWDNWTPLPQLARLDVNRVVDLSIAADIAKAIAGKQGVWLVTWQDEVIDPNGVVPFWLDRIGARPGDAGDFWGVGLEHWRLDPTKVARLEEEPIQWPLAVNFANQLDLVGMTQLNDGELALFWRARQPLPDNLNLTLDLTDHDGFDWDRASAVGPPGSGNYPPSRWPVGQIVLTRHQLPWQIGAPPGLYLAEVGLGQVTSTEQAAAEFVAWDVLDEQGRPQRRTALVDYVNLSDLVEPETGPLPLDANPVVDFFPIVAVRRVILPQASAEPGDRLLLALLWQAGPYNLDDISVAFDLLDAAGQNFRVGAALTPSRRFNLPRWQPGDMVLGQYWLNIPADAAPGPAQLQLHLIDIGAPGYDERFPLAQLEIRPTARQFTPPAAIDMPLAANFSGQISLIGADCAADCQATPGGTVDLTLYWRAESPPERNFTVFTHLLDPADAVQSNADHLPPKPTQGWVTGEIVADPVTLTIPADLPPGDYRIEVGLYDAAEPAYPRLPLSNGETRLILPQPVRVQ